MMEKRKILIVDDSEMNRDLLVDILEDQYGIIEAENGVKAIEILEEQREEISLVLLDIMMPEMDGFGVLSHIYQNHWNESFAVVMISADDSSANIKRAYSLGAFDYISRPFDPAIVQRRISNTMGLYMRQKHLEQMVIKLFHEHDNNNKLMIEILSHIVEFRNGESGSHVMHVNRITEFLLKQLVLHTERYSLSQSDITLISMASSLHDIGKIAISEEILNKPGPLTDEEFEIIKTHAVIGADILLGLPEEYQSIPLVRMAFEICRWHHERYDGKGYPDGLKGDEIPIAAQVVALADVYDALTSERCYKAACSHEEALNMILDGQCGSFNPILLECMQEIMARLKHELTKTTSGQNNVRSSGWKIDYDGILSGKKYNFQSQQQKTLKLLYTDSLTGAYNRRYYDDYIQNAEDIQAAVMIDVDNFKHINDNYGHDTGDIVLHRIAQTILSCVRKSDAVIRYGGDEFAVVFHQIPEETFETKLERMRYSVEVLSVNEYPDIHTSVSIGGVYGTGTAKELFKVADDMMYQSKNTKNRVSICFLNGKAGSMDNI